MKRSLKIAFALAAVIALGTLAYARHRGGHGHHRAFIGAHIDAALDKAQATGPQKAAVNAAVDHVLDAFKDGHKGRADQMERALAMFEADKLDPAQLAAHRARHEAEAKKIGDAIVQAVFDIHGVLTPVQRRAVVDYVRDHKPSDKGGGFRKAFIKRMVESRVDDALDAIKATDAQRATANAAKDKVIAALESGRGNPSADIEKVLTLFAADKLDTAQIDALRVEHQTKMKGIADTVVQAFSDVHASLSAQQRKALVEWVRAHHKRHHG